MAGEMSYELQGLDDVLAKLKSVSSDVQDKGTRFAARKAANVIRDNAKARAQQLDDPETANSIAENVVVRADTKHTRATGDLKMSVGIRGGSTSKRKNARNPGGDTYYWRFKEFGTVHVRATPFMRPAMEESLEPAMAEFSTHLNKALTRAIRKANRGK